MKEARDEGPTLYGPTSMKYPEQAHSQRESRPVVATGRGERGLEVSLLNGYRVLLGMMKNVWEQTMKMVAQHRECT